MSDNSERNLTSEERQARARVWVLEELHKPVEGDLKPLDPVEEERRVRAYLEGGVPAAVPVLPK